MTGKLNGAGEGDRTLIKSLGSFRSAIELHPLSFFPTQSPSLRAGVTPYIHVLRPSGQRRFSPLFKLASCQFVEPSLKAWEASVLPLNYTRLNFPRFGEPR